MKITVQRSGGIAGVNRIWTVQADTPAAKERWMPIVEACPWDEVDRRGMGASGGSSTPESGPTAHETGQPGDGRRRGGLPGGFPRPVPADRFMYSIRAGQRRATLPEQDITGPWKVLVENAKTEGRQSAGR